MPPNTNIETDAVPAFTECVSEQDGTTVSSDGNPLQLAKRLQELIATIEAQPDSSVRGLLAECLQSLLELYGDGLARIMDHVQSRAGGESVLEKLLEDRFVSGLLLVHGLHPVSMQERLRCALEKVRPYLKSHGGNLELLSLENYVARIRLEGTCKTCPSSTVTLELAVRKEVEEACPDLAGFEVETGIEQGVAK